MRKFIYGIPVVMSLASAPVLAQMGGQTGPMTGPMTGPQQTSPMGTQTYPMQTTASGIPLSSVKDASQLTSATVQDKDGDQIGAVKKVLTSGGQPTAVQVEAGTKTVEIKASHAKFEQGRNVIQIDLTRSEIHALPSVQGT